MRLVAGGVDFGDGLGEEVAVDYRAEAGWRWGGVSAGGFDKVVGGDLAEVGDGGSVEGGLGEGSVVLLSFGEGGLGEAAGVEGGAAFTDGFGEEGFG